jgi:hypothetical protein
MSRRTPRFAGGGVAGDFATEVVRGGASSESAQAKSPANMNAGTARSDLRKEDLRWCGEPSLLPILALVGLGGQYGTLTGRP